MQKNEALSKFLRERRKKVGKSQADVAKIIGCSSTPQYNRWELDGRLPTDITRREKLAEVLQVGIEELLDKAGISTVQEQNVVPLVKAIALSNCETMSLEDIEFLLDVQASLDQPMSPQLIQELIRHCSTQTINGDAPPHPRQARVSEYCRTEPTARVSGKPTASFFYPNKFLRIGPQI